MDVSSGQLHCYADKWQEIRIHYSIDFATVRAAENFNAAAGHLTLELGGWEQGNNKFYRYWFDTGTVAGPDAGAGYAYEQYQELYPDTLWSIIEFRAAVEAGLDNVGSTFRQSHNF